MGPRLVLDTNVLIKLMNREPGHEAVTEILDRAEEGELTAVISTITIAEVAAGYYSTGDAVGLASFISHLRSSRGYEIVGVDMQMAELSGRVRAETGLRLPDAIVLATAVKAGADGVITEDARFKKAHRFTPSLTPREFLEAPR